MADNNLLARQLRDVIARDKARTDGLRAVALALKMAGMREEILDQGDLMRTFAGGATRNKSDNKFAYEGFVSPHAIHAYGAYMHKHRKQADGTLRAPDNWQRGIPTEAYMDSLVRHVMDLWLLHRGGTPVDPDSKEPCNKKELLCAILFNVQGMLHEEVKPRVA